MSEPHPGIPPRLELLDGSGDSPTYHAVLRHEDSLGGQESEPASIAPERWPGLSRWGAGLAASAVTMPALYFLLQPSPTQFALVAALSGVTGILGARAGTEMSRREMRAAMTHLRGRMGRLLKGDLRTEDVDAADFESFLAQMSDGFEQNLENYLLRERDAFVSIITSLASALEARDPSTQNHSVRVAKFAARLGNAMKLSRERLYEIHLGGLLHDIGKIGISDAILLKPAGLTRQEYEIMKSHPVLGARILSGVAGLERVSKIVLHHHEMWDGRGYPHGLSGEDIPLGSRIIAAGDTYLSMVEDRPYRDGMPLEKVLKEIRRVSGTQLDPAVVDALVDMLNREVEQYGSPLMGAFAARGAEQASA